MASCHQLRPLSFLLTLILDPSLSFPSPSCYDGLRLSFVLQTLTSTVMFIMFFFVLIIFFFIIMSLILAVLVLCKHDPDHPGPQSKECFPCLWGGRQSKLHISGNP